MKLNRNKARAARASRIVAYQNGLGASAPRKYKTLEGVEITVRPAFVPNEIVPWYQRLKHLDDATMDCVVSNMLYSVGQRADHSFLRDADGRKGITKRNDEHCTQTMHRS